MDATSARTRTGTADTGTTHAATRRLRRRLVLLAFAGALPVALGRPALALTPLELHQSINRVAAAGGSLAVTSPPGRGTLVRAELPLS